MKTLTKYSNVASPGRSAGCVEIEIPIAFLIEQYTISLLLQTLELLQRGTTIDDVDEFLSGHGIGEGTLGFSGFATGARPPAVKWDGTFGGLQRVVQSIDDLCQENGEWREGVDAILDEARDFETLFIQTLQQAVAAAHVEHGLAAATQLVANVISALRGTRDRIVGEGDQVVGPLVKAVGQPLQRVQGLIRRPGKHVQAFTRLLPKQSIRCLLKAGQKKLIRKLTDTAGRLQNARFHHLTRRSALKVLDRLVGNVSETGRLHELLNDLDEDAAIFTTLGSGISELRKADISPTVTKIPIVTGLDTVLDHESGRTVSDEFQERAARAGRTAHNLARHIHRNGVTIRKERVMPHKWSEADPSQLQEKLLALSRKYLGCEDPNRTLDMVDPKSAADHFSRLQLLHPILRHRLHDALKAAQQRSAPYAEFGELAGVKENIQTFVFCFKTQRPEYIKLLERQDGSIAEAERASEYSTQHPYSILLLQYRIAAPIGAMPALHRWSILAARAELKGRVKSMEPRSKHSETRHFKDRIHCLSDCRDLFNAASKVGLVMSVGSTGKFALTMDDHRLTAMFAPPKWQANAVPGSRFLELLKEDDDVKTFLTRQFTNDPDLRVVLARLKNEHDDAKVTDELVRRNVLKPEKGRFAVNAVFSTNPRWAPRELVTQVAGPLIGIDEDDFITQLYENDLLYTVLFFGVMDEWQLRELSESDVPTSVIEFVNDLI